MVKTQTVDKSAFASPQPLTDSVSFSGTKFNLLKKNRRPVWQQKAQNSRTPILHDPNIESILDALQKNGGKMDVPSIFEGHRNIGTIELKKPSFLKRLIFGKTHDFSLKTEHMEDFKTMPNKIDHLRISISQERVAPTSRKIIRASRAIITQGENEATAKSTKLKGKDLLKAGFDLKVAAAGIMKFSEKQQ